MADPNLRGWPSEASWATRASDRVELPFLFAHPSGKMTHKIWPANSGPAISGSLNVRAWPAYTFPFGTGELEQEFSAGKSSRRQGRPTAGWERLWPARALTWRSGLAVTPRAHMQDFHYRIKREIPIYQVIFSVYPLLLPEDQNHSEWEEGAHTGN